MRSQAGMGKLSRLSGGGAVWLALDFSVACAPRDPLAAGPVKAPRLGTFHEFDEGVLALTSHAVADTLILQDVGVCHARMRTTSDNQRFRPSLLHQAGHSVQTARLIGHGGEPEHIRCEPDDTLRHLLCCQRLHLHVDDLDVIEPTLPGSRRNRHDPERMHVRVLRVGVVGLNEEDARHDGGVYRTTRCRPPAGAVEINTSES